MNRREFAAELSKRTGLSQRSAARLLEEVLDLITDTLSAGEPVHLRGFGEFSVNQRAPRTCRDFSTSQTTVRPAKIIPVFTPFGTLTDRVNEKEGTK